MFIVILAKLVRHSNTGVTLFVSDFRRDRDTRLIEKDKSAEVSGLPL